MSSELIGTCVAKPLTTDGKWDASEGKCVKCAGQMEDRVYNVSGAALSDVDIVNRCESACGGPAIRDEQADCSIPTCAVYAPTIVSITPASFAGPAGGSKTYAIKVMNNNTNCGSYSINFDISSVDPDLAGPPVPVWPTGNSTGTVGEGLTGTVTITVTAQAAATPGTKNFTISAFPHEDSTGIDYTLKSATATASYIIGPPPPETCNDPGIADEDGNGLANCADIAVCSVGAKCEGGGECQAGGICVVSADIPCSGSAMFTSVLGSSCSIKNILSKAITWILFLAMGILLLVVIIGAIQYITSAGEEEKLRMAKNMLFYGILGFAIILLAYTLITEVPGIL
jgi:hypothetical protein